MPGEGPFLWLSDSGPPSGYWKLPPNGLCISAFVFVTKGDRLLLGKYADDPRWTELTGLDPDRYRTHGKGWTLPATHLKFGEPPREAARRVAEDVLGLRGLPLREAGVESDQYTPKRFPHLGEHYDLWLFYEATLPPDAFVVTAASVASEDQDAAPERRVVRPAWYRELSFEDPRALPAEAYARGHEDVVARWLGRA